MTDIQQLRRTLIDHEDLAPDGAGLVEAAQGAAARIRHRRRVGRTAGVALATAVMISLAPAVVSHLRGGTRDSTPGHGSYRDSMQITLEIASGSGYEIEVDGVVGTTQYAVVRPLADKNRYGATVLVHDPGTYDGSRLLHGTRVTVQGHRAYYVPDLPMGTAIVQGVPEVRSPAVRPSQSLLPLTPSTPEPVTVPAVGWQDASGAWVVVYVEGWTADPESEALRVGGTVRLGPARDVRVPYQLGYVPLGLPGSEALISHQPNDQETVLSFGGQPTWNSPFPPAGIDSSLPLGIQVLPRSDYVDSPIHGKAPTARIAGHDVWYFTDSRQAGISFPDAGSVLLVHFGQCAMTVVVADRSRIPYPELVEMVANARFADCMDAATWTPPVG